jgi:hypothetical protein
MHVLGLGDLGGRPHAPDRLHGHLRLQTRRVRLSRSRQGFPPFAMPPTH